MNISGLSIAFGQINPTVGDFEANFHQIRQVYLQASRQKNDLIVFPEMALCGYPVWDLAHRDDFIRASQRSLNQLLLLSKKSSAALVIGLITAEVDSRRSRNTAAFIHRGKILGLYHKRLLPTYDVFLEDIYFEPGNTPCVIDFKDRKIGLTICEDIWDTQYDVKPVDETVKAGAQIVINLSASPYYSGAFSARKKVLESHSKKFKVPMVYSNLVGAQDDLIFDGQSFATNAKGEFIGAAPAFEAGYFDSLKKQPTSTMRSHERDAEVYEALKLGIRDYCRKNKFSKAVLGLSGGIDSALTAALACDALGPDAVLGVTMPGPYSSKGSWKDSEALAERLGMNIETRPIQESYQMQARCYGVADHVNAPALALENLQARLRGLQLMFISNQDGRLVLSTGNKSELAMGYCTLYGDMCGGLAVLGDVYKTQVYRLSRYRNSISRVIPEAILRKAPSAELRPNQKDQDSLPPYPVLDKVLHAYIEKGLGPQQIYSRLKPQKLSLSQIRDIIRRVDHNEYKRRQTPPILRVTEKAWFGRRMPITNRFEPLP